VCLVRIVLVVLVIVGVMRILENAGNESASAEVLCS